MAISLKLISGDAFQHHFQFYIVWGNLYCTHLWQNTADLSDLVSSGRDRKSEEVAFAEECEIKGSIFRAERLASFI